MQKDDAKSQNITWKIQTISSLVNQEEFPCNAIQAFSSLKFPEKPKRKKEVII